MDIQRIVLLVALVVVSLLLWDAWQKDYPAQHVTTPTHQTQKTTAATASGTTPKTTTFPTIEQPKTQTSAATSTTANKVKGLTVNVPKERIVNVKTDVFDVKIDTLGGNIVGLGLPKYPKALKTPNIPITLLNDAADNYYVAQSALIGNFGPDTGKKQAQFTSAKSSYVLGKDDKSLEVKLNWQGKDGLDVTKVYTFHKGSYLIDVSYIINNKSSKEWKGNFYTQLTRNEPQEKGHSWFQIHPYMGAAYGTPTDHYNELSFKKFTSEPLSIDAKAGWVAMVQHYFLSAWVPNKEQQSRFYSKTGANDTYTIGMASSDITVPAGQSKTITSQLYSGPEITSTLKAIAPGLNFTVSYGWLWPISIFIFWLMKHIYDFIGNWGWSIIIVTILIKLAFYHLSSKSYRSMANMRKLQPKIEQLRERFKDDKQKLSKAMMELYKKEKANPLGGCLPMIIQIPVFFALYMVLIESVELRQAPWILWIHDLSRPDPYYILPILMGITMFIQQKLNPPPPDPTQAKVMMFLPVIFTVLFANFPSGLVLYWFVNSALSVLQQWHIMRKVEKADAKKKLKR